jgi:hypothetical protein
MEKALVEQPLYNITTNQYPCHQSELAFHVSYPTSILVFSQAYYGYLIMTYRYLTPILDRIWVPTLYLAYQFPSVLLFFLSLFWVSKYDKGLSYHMKNNPKI